MILLILLTFILVVHGQLSVDELFSFHSKYASTGNCNDFQYIFRDLEIHFNNYNQLSFDCNSSSISLRNEKQISSVICPNNNENFRIYFQDFSQTLIQVNQIHLHGIELCSLDDFIRNKYPEYSHYRSQWALLINLPNKYHLALTTDGEMIFLIFILSSEYNTILKEHQIEIIFPNENTFEFKLSSIEVWQIDEGFVRNPRSLESSFSYQLSKSKFTLFNNETFLLYGTQISYPRRFIVTIDQTVVPCIYDHILQCTFPILPLNIRDTHKPVLTVIYNRITIFNQTLTLIPRTRLDQVPTNHSITKIGTLQVNLDANLCVNDSLRSLFTFIIHLWKEDINGTVRYQQFVKNDIRPIDCNTTMELGREIEQIVNKISIDDIISMDLDLTHQWYDHQNCQKESTRITFI